MSYFMDCSPARLLCPWDFPGKNTGVSGHFLLRVLPDPGIKPASPALAGGFSTNKPPGNPAIVNNTVLYNQQGPTV